MGEENAENNVIVSPAVYRLGNKVFSCPIDLAHQAISGKWKLLILFRLVTREVMRFSELKKEIDDISEKMLIQQLKELTKEGLVKRKVYPVVPPKVEYTLTDKGKAVAPVIELLRTWGTGFQV